MIKKERRETSSASYLFQINPVNPRPPHVPSKRAFSDDFDPCTSQAASLEHLLFVIQHPPSLVLGLRSSFEFAGQCQAGWVMSGQGWAGNGGV